MFVHASFTHSYAVSMLKVPPPSFLSVTYPETTSCYMSSNIFKTYFPPIAGWLPSWSPLKESTVIPYYCSFDLLLETVGTDKKKWFTFFCCLDVSGTTEIVQLLPSTVLCALPSSRYLYWTETRILVLFKSVVSRRKRKTL